MKRKIIALIITAGLGASASFIPEAYHHIIIPLLIGITVAVIEINTSKNK